MRSWAHDEEETHFLNVDVDVWSRSRLGPLVVAFGENVFVHYVGPEGKEHCAHFSLAGAHGKDADSLTRRLAALVTKLPRNARKLWDQARRKDFNIGIQGGLKPHDHQIVIEQETLKLVARIGSRIVVTTYATTVHSKERSKPLRRRSVLPNDALQRTSRRNRGRLGGP